jgi:hypothetical protein
MTKEEDVVKFLKDFKVKLNIFQIVYRDDRGKNSQALLDLEISPYQRSEIIKTIEAKNYSEGPLVEKLYDGSDMWVFGKEVKGKDVYIKISMGFKDSPVICISFHIAERKMNFPFN